MDGAEWLLRSAESLLSFKSVFLPLLRAFLLLILPVTLLLMLSVKILSYLTGVLRCRRLSSEESIMLRNESIVLLFQLGRHCL